MSVLAALDARRGSAFEQGRADLLDAVYAPGSSAGDRDTAALSRLTSAGLQVAALRLEIETADVIDQSPTSVRLRVTDRLPAYEIVDAAGGVVEARPARGRATWIVELRRTTTAEWRIWSVATSS